MPKIQLRCVCRFCHIGLLILSSKQSQCTIMKYHCLMLVLKREDGTIPDLEMFLSSHLYVISLAFEFASCVVTEQHHGSSSKLHFTSPLTQNKRHFICSLPNLNAPLIPRTIPGPLPPQLFQQRPDPMGAHTLYTVFIECPLSNQK